MLSGSTTLSYDSPMNKSIWLSLAFQAGSINVGGFLACHRFVTHTTGFATLFGAEVAQKNWINAFGFVTVPLFFLAGAMLSAFFVDRRIILGQKPNYHHVFFLMTLFMIVITYVGLRDGFGAFGDEIRLSHDYSFIALLSLTSGLQNAIITTAFGAIVRTTHLTGLTTDLGIGLVRLIFNLQNPEKKQQEWKANIMRASIIFSFVLGSAFAGFIFLKGQYIGFLIPVTISGSLFLLSLKHQAGGPFDRHR